MSLRRDIHAALDPVTPTMPPHLPFVALSEVRPSRPSQRARLRVVAACVGGIAIVGLAAAWVTLHATTTTPAGPASAVAPVHLVVTRWVSDPSVTAGPFPGYRPVPIGTGRMAITSVSAHPDAQAGQSEWVVDFTLSPASAATFSEASSNAVRACEHCLERRLTTWVDLTASDMAGWAAAGPALYQPYWSGGKLLADPYVVSPITGGRAQIAGLSEAQAKSLAAALHRGMTG